MNYFFKRIYLILICFVLGNSSLPAQLAPWDYNGYVKNLLTYSDGTIKELPVEPGHFQNTLQTRFNLSWYPAANITVTGQARNVFTYQKNIKISNSFLQELRTNSYYLDLKTEWNDPNDGYAFSEIDRLNLEWYGQSWSMTLGRQRITWATCLVWNPTDLFNPFDILDFDYEERPGTDALQVQYYPGPLSQIGIAFTPGRSREDMILAARFLTNRWQYDFNFLAGWQKSGLRLGLSWAGDIADGGFRGELLYSDPDLRYRILNLNPQSLDDLYIEKYIKDPYWTVALSYDYTFRSSLYIHSEYIYNGQGTTGKAGERRFDINFSGELTPARHSLYQGFGYNITPLIRGSFFIIFNPNDHSWIAAPSVQYNFATNWEFYLLMFPTGGEEGTEYGGFPTQYFVRIQYSF